MCGFLTCFINKNNRDNLITFDEFKNASLDISHRGPDSNSIFNFKNNVYFAHYRLSIIHRNPSSNQPFFSKCKRYILCFNGEIYNYKYLSQRYFPRENIKGDTELLMYLLVNKKYDNFLNELEGMFSFVFYDIKKDYYFAARDRFGIKPLYYYIDEYNSIFCSEPYPIAKLKRFEIDEISLKELQCFRRPTPGYSFYKNVNECLPGFIIKKNKIERWKESLSNKCSDKFCQDELFDRIKYVFDLNTIGDLPHCSFQSGGIDSSLIALLTNPSKVYTVGMIDDNEYIMAKKIAQKLNILIKEFMIDKNQFIDLLENYLQIKKEPISVPNEILIYKICEEIKSINKFFLSGEGADEIFFGYDRIFKWSRTEGNISNDQKFLDAFLKKYCYSRTLFKSERLLKFCHQIFSNCETRTDFLEDFFLNFHLVGLLARADRASMAAGVEARVPFCSHTISNYMYRRPYEIKIKGDFAKYPLREIIKKSSLKFILNTPKIGFRTLVPGFNQLETYDYMLRLFIKNYKKK
tara:strand:+ start:27297 stop:28859 length:1563 start_codon:yes stop_codon:yes gene_type:complete